MMPKFLLVASLAALALVLSSCGGESEEKLLESARTFLARNDTKAAIIQLKTVLQKNDKSVPGRILLGKALLEAGAPVPAMVELRKAQELGSRDDELLPELARAMLMVGEHAKVVGQYAGTELKDPKAAADLLTSVATAQALEGDHAKAQVSSERALQLLPGYAPAIILQAQLKAGEDNIDGALMLLDAVLGQDAGNERAGVMKGDLLRYGKQDVAGAMAAYQAVLALHPKAVSPRSSMIAILDGQGKADAARQQLEELKKAAPNHPETLYLQARAAFAAKDYKTARDLGNRLLTMAPNAARVLELAGATEFRLNSDVQAEALLGRALKLNPANLRVRHILAQIHMRSSQPAKAIEVLQPAIEGPKADGLSLALAGEAFLHAGDVKRSDDAFQRAAKVAPQDPRVRTSVALSKLARGNTGAALIELEGAANDDKSPRANLALIAARLGQNDYDGAMKAVEALKTKMPDGPLPEHMRGRILLLKKDNAGATTAFQAALAKDASYFPASASLAGMDLAAGKPDAARARFEALLKVDPKNYRALLALADLASRNGSAPAEVMRQVGEAVKASPGEPAPRLLLIEGLLRQGDAQAALTAAQDASAALPANLILMDALGRAQLAAGDSQQAASTFKKLAGLQPNSVSAQLHLADAYATNNDNEAASRALRRALEIDPRANLARRGLVTLALRDRQPEKALELAREAQKLDAKDATGWTLEGDVEASRKNWTAAIAAYKAALPRDQAADSAVRLHQALTTSGQRAEADRFSAAWQRDNPKDPSFRYYLGDVALARGDLSAAEGYYKAVIAVQPDNALAMNNVAWLLVKQSKTGAVALAERANELAPGRAQLLDTLATALAADNQVAKALDVQKKAVAAAPKDPGMRLNLARLYLKSGDKSLARTELQELGRLSDKFAGQTEVSELMKAAQ
jgi:putative PEP-CTERM system TPR-repeat lipoprotein